MTETNILTKEELKEIILKNPNGFTIDLSGNLIKKGFACAFTNSNQKIDLNQNIDNLFKMIKEGFNNLDKKKVYIGYWKENNIDYLDLTKLVNKKNALYLSKIFNQKGIFQIEKNLFIENKFYKEIKQDDI